MMPLRTTKPNAFYLSQQCTLYKCPLKIIGKTKIKKVAQLPLKCVLV